MRHELATPRRNASYGKIRRYMQTLCHAAFGELNKRCCSQIHGVLILYAEFVYKVMHPLTFLLNTRSGVRWAIYEAGLSDIPLPLHYHT